MTKRNDVIRLFLGIWAAYIVFGYLKPESISGQIVDFAVSFVRNGDLFLRYSLEFKDVSLRNGSYLLGHFPGAAVPVIISGYFLEPVIYFLGPGKDFLFMNLVSVFFISTLFGALTAVIFYMFLERMGIPRGDRVLFTLVFAFGTMNFNYSSALYKVNQVSLYLFLSFFLVYSAGTHRRVNEGAVFFAAGLLCGLAVITHPVYLTAALPVFVYTVLSHGRTAALFFAGGAVIPALGLIVYLKEAFGGYFAQPYQFREAGYPCVYTVPRISNFLRLFLGWRGGLFVYLPVLLFSLAGAYKSFRERSGVPETSVVLTAVVFTGILFSGWVHSAPPGDMVFTHDASIPARFLAPLCPFIMLLAVRGVSSANRKWFLVCAAVSVFFSYLGVQAGFIPDSGGWQVSYALKVLVTGFGMPYIFSTALPGIFGYETLHTYIAKPEVTLNSLAVSDVGETVVMCLIQLVLFAIFAGVLSLIVMYFRGVLRSSYCDTGKGVS